MRPFLLTLCAGLLVSVVSMGQHRAPATPQAATKKSASARPQRVARPRRAAAIVLTESTAGKTPVRLTPGDTLVLALDENPTTGYQWSVAVPPAPTRLRPTGDRFVGKPAAPEQTGVGGTRELRFVALTAGKTQLDLNYQRSWEKDNPARSLRVAVEVR